MRKTFISQLKTNKLVANYKLYLNKFEQELIVEGIRDNLFGKDMMVTVKNGKLSDTDFGMFVGNEFDCDLPVAIDYYGFIKKSTGFVRAVNSYSDVEIKSIKSSVVYFASIRTDHIKKISPSLVSDFGGFKKFLIALRGFTT